MTELYENFMVTGLPGLANSGFGPVPARRTCIRPAARTTIFNPYTEDTCYSRRKMYKGNSVTERYFGHQDTFTVDPPSYLSDEGHILGTDTYLTNGFYFQDFLPLNAGNRPRSFKQAFGIKSLQNLCVQTSETGTSFRLPQSAIREDRNHPFYYRKRVEPAEGMTRTRDKYRVVYTDKQRKGLEKEYKINKFITTERKTEISSELGLSARQIKIWFQNRRAKERKDLRKDKDIEPTHSDKSFEDNNKGNKLAPCSLSNVNLSTSSLLPGSDSQLKERLYNVGNCRFMDRQTDIDTFASSKACFLKSRGLEVFGHPVSPTDWSTSAENNLIPALDVSPITGSANFGSDMR